MDLHGAVALVTGGSGGLGTVIAGRLAETGSDVAVGYRSGEERARVVVAKVEAQGRRAIAVELDHTDPSSAAAAVARIAEDLGGLDLLINNAGMAAGGHRLPPGDLDALTPEIWDEMMAVNVRGPYLMARAAAPLLRRSRWGRIVNLGSTIGHGPWRADAAFAASKGAVAPLTVFLAAALAPDVAVNCVAPGLMQGTRMTSAAPPEFVELWKRRAITGATTSLDDVATHVLAFCRSGTVTGQVLIVDGGVHFG